MFSFHDGRRIEQYLMFCPYILPFGDCHCLDIFFRSLWMSHVLEIWKKCLLTHPDKTLSTITETKPCFLSSFFTHFKIFIFSLIDGSECATNKSPAAHSAERYYRQTLIQKEMFEIKRDNTEQIHFLWPFFVKTVPVTKSILLLFNKYV